MNNRRYNRHKTIEHHQQNQCKFTAKCISGNIDFYICSTFLYTVVARRYSMPIYLMTDVPRIPSCHQMSFAAFHCEIAALSAVIQKK